MKLEWTSLYAYIYLWSAGTHGHHHGQKARGSKEDHVTNLNSQR